MASKSQSLTTDNQSLKRENAELKVAVQSLQEVISGLCQELDEVRLKTQMSDREVMIKFKEAKILIEELKSNLAVKMLEKSDDEDRLKRLSEELESLIGRNHQLEIEKNLLKGHNEKLLKSSQNFRMKFDELLEFSSAVKEEKEEQSSRIKSLEDEIVFLKEQMANDQINFQAQKALNDSDCQNLRSEKLELMKEKIYLENVVNKLKNGKSSNHNNNSSSSNNNYLPFSSLSAQKNVAENSPQTVDGAHASAASATSNNSHDGSHLVKQKSEPAFSLRQEGADEQRRSSIVPPPTSSSGTSPPTDRLECSFCHHVSSSFDELLKHGTYCNL